MNDPIPAQSSCGMSFADKSSLYREVLAIDPASRIFLPYARMLAAEGLHEEAAEVLAKGLAECPEFLEARLFLIEVLAFLGRDSAASVEASGIIEALSASPSFWKVWSRFPGVRADQASMLLFLSACMNSGTPLSLADVVEAGIRSVSSSPAEMPSRMDKRISQSSASSPVPAPASETQAASAVSGTESSPAAPSQREEPLMPWYALDEVPDDDDLPDDEPPAGSGEFPPPASVPAGKTSLRTRTMAMLLEEQGAPDEAAGIYRELLSASSSPEERAELAARIENLAQDASVQAAPQPQLVSILEKLAERLETRSRA